MSKTAIVPDAPPRCSQRNSDFHDRTIKNTRSIGHPILDERGDVVEFVAASIDVTEHHRARQALRRSEAYLCEG